MRKYAMLLVIASFLLTLTSCDNNQETMVAYKSNQTIKTYGTVNKLLLSEVRVITDAIGEIDIEINEYFSPSLFSKLEAYQGDIDFVTIEDDEGNLIEYAKYIKVDNVIYEANIEDNQLSYLHADNDIQNLVLTNKLETKNYIEAILNNQVFILKNNEDEVGIKATTKYGSLSKRNSSYWPKGINDTKGWLENITAIEKFFEENYFNEVIKTNRNEITNVWSVNDATTGATIKSFNDYLPLILDAIDKLEVDKKWIVIKDNW